MSTQAMGSHGNGGERQQALLRQGSFYNLTLNEVQDHLGEPLLSMNLDDLLRNVLPPDPQRPFEIDLRKDAAEAPALQRQGSVSLSRALSKKTVDEVWKDIQRGHGDPIVDETGPAAGDRSATLGEMTLEDFLLKAGVVAEGWDRSEDGGVDAAGQREFQQGAACWLEHYQQAGSQQVLGGYGSGHSIPLQLQAVGGGDVGYSDQMGISSPMSESPAVGRKRTVHSDMVEKTVERRQKRMIKNRESAARSRARKQAYTHELENKVSRLEEENEMLKRQRELDRILYATPVPEPKFKLRRTSSAPM